MAKLKLNQFILAGHLITERPILFQTDMVRATLDDRKTQTRRTKGLESINECPVCWQYKGAPMKPLSDFHVFVRLNKNNEGLYIKHIFSPYGKPGDLLWVKETCQTWALGWVFKSSYGADLPKGIKWKPSIHMPKEAARIWLMIEDIRVERLKDISCQDAIEEGIQELGIYDFPIYKDYLGKSPDGYQHPIYSFNTLWISINGRESFDANPWVWVVKFRVLSKTGRPSGSTILENYTQVIQKEVVNESNVSRLTSKV